MKRPRVTVRKLMLAVMVVALLLGGTKLAYRPIAYRRQIRWHRMMERLGGGGQTPKAAEATAAAGSVPSNSAPG
jgi:hypothetical protein